MKDMGFSHGDIRATKMLLTAENQIKLTDFEMATERRKNEQFYSQRAKTNLPPESLTANAEPNSDEIDSW